ncbi:MAG: ABC transporter ATP-binding protein [Sulfolobales archaeon]|nr:ABC transporter ATP-binding protein [Sulfolobales archaeon]MDW7969840.1 ABC transporter ATP-binding protein [Sulfolobales archaeon]
MNAAVAIKVLGIEVKYKSLNVLDDLSFEVAEGEVTSIIGPNGSGKTTLLKTVDGILKPYRGSVYVDMKEVCRIPKKELAKLVGYVPQLVNLQQGIKVIDFVLTGRRPYVDLLPTKRDVDVALSKLRMVRADHLVGRDLNELSSGELQRVMIARALTSEPKVLLLDEPTSNLDLRFQVEVLGIVRELSKIGMTTLMALHDLTHAYRYSNKIIMINNGKIFAVGRPEEVLTEENIERVYGVKARVIQDVKAVITLDY